MKVQSTPYKLPVNIKRIKEKSMTKSRELSYKEEERNKG